MRHLMIMAAALALTTPAGGALAQARGLSPGQLQDQGWSCFNVPGLGVHCSPPGQPFPPEGPSSQLLYFYDTNDPNSRTPSFSGTESLMSDEVFNGQPCPTEDGAWTFLGALGLDYWACHRNHKHR